MFHPRNSTLIILIVAIGAAFASPSFAQKDHLESWQKPKFEAPNNEHAENTLKCKIAGLEVAVWSPPPTTKYPVPFVIFSHGNHGMNTQSIFIMKAMAKAGYLVMAPEHRDAFVRLEGWRHQASFRNASSWSEKTFSDRGHDIKNLLAALRDDDRWKNKIDWSKIALAGHSLGGYTVLALAGGWPSWKITGIKAVIALSPYCLPLSQKGCLQNINVPVLYESGTRDVATLPSLRGPYGAMSKTSSPAYLVVFEGIGHFGWTDFNHNQEEKDLINYYSVSFLNKYLRDDITAKPDLKLPGVTTVKVK